MRERKLYLVLSVAVMGAFAATSVSAWESPLKRRYMTKPLQVCDEGLFYVGGAPKVTPYHAGPAGGTGVLAQTQHIIGKMYVHFQTPMVSKSWPVIMVHGSGYTGSCVQGTAGGSEGWQEYAVRNGVPTFVVDQAGRARSGFDHTVFHEGEALIDTDPAAAKALIPTLTGAWGSTAWDDGRVNGRWFGHVEPFGSDITVGTMVRHGAPGDPECAIHPAHCNQLGRLPMEPEAPWAVDQAIKSRTGNGAPAGLGTITPDTVKIATNAAYLALDAYKFDVPNTENTLPGSTCANCNPTNIAAANTWTPKALAELVEGLGGAVVATHSQSGIMGHHMARILKEHGKLNLLKGLITIEGSCSFAQSGVTAADFVNIPYLAFKGDYTPSRQECVDAVNAINAAGGKAQNIELDQPGWWQGSYAGPFGEEYVGPFAGVSHMMMIESNPGPSGRATNLEVMDVLLRWTTENVSKPKTVACAEGGQGQGGGTGAPGNGKGQGAANNNSNGRF